MPERYIGLTWTAKLGPKGGTTAIIGGQNNGTLTETMGAAEVTDKSGNGVQEFIPGLTGWTLTCDGAVVIGDTALGSIATALSSRARVDVAIQYPGSGDPENGYTNVTRTGTGVITDYSVNAPIGDAVTFSVTIQGTGVLSAAA